MQSIWGIGFGWLAVVLLAGCAQTAPTTEGPAKPERMAQASSQGALPDDDPLRNPKLTELFVEAATLQAQGDNDRAIRVYEDALALDPNLAAVHYNLALIQHDRNLPSAALPYAQQAVELDPTITWYDLLLVEIYLGLEREEDALRAMRAAIDKHPEDLDLLIRLADVQLKAQRFEAVLSTYAEIEKRSGERRLIAEQRKEVFLLMGRPDRAIEQLRVLQADYPTHSPYAYQLHDLYLTEGQTDSAAAVLERLYAANPNDAFALFNLADYYQSRGEMRKARALMQRAFENPQVPLERKVQFLTTLMARQESLADGEAIEELIVMLYSQHPDDGLVLSLMAERALANEKPDSALVYFREATAAAPTNRTAWEQLLILSEEQASPAVFLQDAEAAYRVYPNDAALNAALGRAYVKAGQPEAAIRPLQKAIKLTFDDQAQQTALHVELGNAYALTGANQDARSEFEKALALQPNNQEARNAYARFLAQNQTDLERAEDLIQQVVAQDQDNPTYLATLGLVLYQQGNYSDAKIQLKRAYELEALPEWAEQLGDAYFQLGQTEKALIYWRESQTLGNTSPELQRKINQRSIP